MKGIQQIHLSRINAVSLFNQFKLIDELEYAVVGGIVGDDGIESVRRLSYNVVLTHAAKAIQELRQLAKAQQLQIDKRLKT